MASRTGSRWCCILLERNFWGPPPLFGAGGKGFLLGDGHLNYGREKISEIFYTIHVWRGAYGAFDLQHINNPGYNRDLGPVLVPAVRLHLDR